LRASAKVRLRALSDCHENVGLCKGLAREYTYLVGLALFLEGLSCWTFRIGALMRSLYRRPFGDDRDRYTTWENRSAFACACAHSSAPAIVRVQFNGGAIFMHRGGAIVFDGAAIVDAEAKEVPLSRRRRAEAVTVDAGAVRRMAAAQFT
jgi:hypothetical protein